MSIAQTGQGGLAGAVVVAIKPPAYYPPLLREAQKLEQTLLVPL